MDWTRIRTLQALISRRWEPAILMTLRHGAMRSARLREAVSPGLSYKAFSETVQALQKKGFVERIERRGPDRRTRVFYQLTDEGNVIMGLLAQVDDWALIHSRDLPTTYPSNGGQGATAAGTPPEGLGPDGTAHGPA